MDLINKYYPEDNELRRLLILHSSLVADLSLKIAENLIISDNIVVDTDFIREAAMLHDIGIFRCNAPSIFCLGNLPYIRHGLEGAEILRSEGLPRHALVCERHTGSGLTREEIIERNLPLPHCDFLPISIEEKIICAADKFYSKSGDPRRRKTIEEITEGMMLHGAGPLRRWQSLCQELRLSGSVDEFENIC
ncbi:MAG: HDIG domain-containing protein [Muribaculaceae bacterium]|nr:HDIG domain-containing protein [Muribaculaceae bacterium]